MESPHAYYFNEESQISYFWLSRGKSLPSIYKVRLTNSGIVGALGINFPAGHDLRARLDRPGQ